MAPLLLSVLGFGEINSDKEFSKKPEWQYAKLTDDQDIIGADLPFDMSMYLAGVRGH